MRVLEFLAHTKGEKTKNWTGLNKMEEAKKKGLEENL